MSTAPLFCASHYPLQPPGKIDKQGSQMVDLIVISNQRLRLLIRSEMLSPRQETILKSIVGQYIIKATPVASRYIVADRDLGVSPATIRNEMARLEEDGYITRQHPSAGSVPSDRGYRYYVESLGDIELPQAEQRMVSHLFHQVEKELDEWLKLAAKLLAQLVHNMALVTVPRTAHCRFRYIELVSLREHAALGVFVLRGARVRQRIIYYEAPLSQAELTAVASRLNTIYADLNAVEIETVETELSVFERQVTDQIVSVLAAEESRCYEEPYLDGLHFILGQPEFVGGGQLKSLLEMIDQRTLPEIIKPDSLGESRPQVLIGHENTAVAIQNCSLVVGCYGPPGEAIGVIGVIGPTRMPYARAISTVSYLSLVLSRLATELYENN